jgi:hypothetical protein
VDEFTAQRLTRFLSGYKQSHGRDASHADLTQAGFSDSVIDGAVRAGMLDKHQVTTGKGSVENRYKLHKDWRSLRT